MLGYSFRFTKQNYTVGHRFIHFIYGKFVQVNYGDALN